MSEHVEVVECWLTAPRYLQQVGDSEPQYIAASPLAPVKVRIPGTFQRKRVDKETGEVSFETVKFKEDANLKKARPAAPKDVRPANQPAKVKQNLAQPTAKPEAPVAEAKPAEAKESKK